MSDPDISLDDLVNTQRHGVALDSVRHGHNRRLLMARIAVAGGAAASLASAATATGKLAGGLLGKVLVAVSLLGTAGGGYYLLAGSASEPLPVRQAPQLAQAPNLRAPQRSSSPALVASEEPVVAEKPPEPSKTHATPTQAPAHKAGSTETRAPDASLSDDVRLMQQVSQALKAGNAAQALELLNRDPSQGSSAMREEKAAARVVTLCQLGRIAEARTEATIFQKKYPRSPLASRVRSSCVKDDPAD